MRTYQVNLLNPKAAKLLKELAELKLIELKETSNDFFVVVAKLRKKAERKKPSLDEITKEVEIIRAERYDK
jgi:hypothetical protein